MIDYADLEIAIRHATDDTYAVELRSVLPDSDADIRTWGEARFDMARLRALSLDMPAYARFLTDSLLNDPEIRAAFSSARSTAQAKEMSLRIRLLIDQNAQELHNIRWEALADARDNSYLFAGEQVIFSRYLSSPDWQPVHLRPAGAPTALVLVANPNNLADYNLASLDVEDELARARASMSGVDITELASGGTATLSNLIDRLRKNPVDILYLVCHGSMIDREAWLWMEGEDGTVAHERGDDFAANLKELRQRPRIVVLACCQSAGRATENHDSGCTLAAVGPRVAAAGIPAVVAMQGNVSIKTVAQFMPVFFREFLRTGQIDNAMAVARGVVRNCPDFWMPVLFMRSKSGRIWTELPSNVKPVAEIDAKSLAVAAPLPPAGETEGDVIVQHFDQSIHPDHSARSATSWKGLFIVAIAALVAGLAFAYIRAHTNIPATTPPVVSGSTPAQGVAGQSRSFVQKSSGAGSPNINGVQGNITITVDQSTGNTTPKKSSASMDSQKPSASMDSHK